MKREFSDPWFQTFFAIAAMSGAFLVYGFLARRQAPVEAAASLPAALPSDPSAPTAALELAMPPPLPLPAAREMQEMLTQLASARAVRAAAAGSPSAAAAGSPSAAATPPPPSAAAAPPPSSYPIFPITAKTPGRWLVSGRDDADADGPSIARVIHSASDGDLILLRPGLYTEPLVVAGKNLTLRGLGKRPEEVLLSAPDSRAVLRVENGQLALENLSIQPQKGFPASAAAVHATSGRLSLKNVVARTQGAAVQAEQGRGESVFVEIASSRLDGGYADLLVRGRASVRLRDVRFSNAHQPIVIWRDAALRAESCRFAKAARLYAYDDSSIRVSGAAPPVLTRRGDLARRADRGHFPNLAASSADKPAGGSGTGASKFLKDIFRPGRKPGDID